MQSQKDFSAPSTCAPKLSAPVVVAKPPPQATLEDVSQEQMNSEEFHLLLDVTMVKSVSHIIFTAMGTMTDTLSHSITRVLLSAQRPPALMAQNPPESKPVAPSGCKSAKKPHHIDEESSKTVEMDSVHPVNEDVVTPHQRALPPGKIGEDLEECKSPQ
ncbi:Hypothetical predicted protein [Pelobates cultripes]|uniref:Uncharacterized protein n=1 Tax=Pelobates cultripes TaxID=61616 RepID=A0AAD1WEJ9_PELCU|nr:Hypothetical predicted protein [Pelobates cultripes]